MIAPSGAQIMAAAEIRQLQQNVAALMADREQYARLVVLLARYVVDGGKAKIIGGHVAVDRADFEGVPTRWTLALMPAKVKPAEAAEDAPSEDVIVVKVDPKATEANGVLAPQKPRIILPGGA